MVAEDLVGVVVPTEGVVVFVVDGVGAEVGATAVVEGVEGVLQEAVVRFLFKPII